MIELTKLKFEGYIMGTIFISEQACSPLKKYLKNSEHNIIFVKKSTVVYNEISAHPDIYMCKIGNRLIVDNSVMTEPDLLKWKNGFTTMQNDDSTPYISNNSESDIILAGNNLGMAYPDNVAYNAVVTNKFFIHNVKHTLPAIKRYSELAELVFIDVRQGYTRCSCIPVGDTAIITYDEGILTAVAKYNENIRNNSCGKASDRSDFPSIDTLKIEKGHVQLSGFDYGFLGGSCGTVENNIIFNGDLDAHPDAARIRDFIEARGFNLVSFPGEVLSDIGSIICLP